MKSHYPDFNILDQQAEWDPHTQEIVLKRLENPGQPKFFSLEERDTMISLSASLLDEERVDILEYIVSWYDAKLLSSLGEGERGENIPPEGELIHSGLRALETAAQVIYGKGVVNLPHEVREALLRQLQQGSVTADMKWSTKVQQALFKKLLVSVTKAYYSHPTVWSEIGYGGPAYPRGYVRSELGLTDPWEAKRSD